MQNKNSIISIIIVFIFFLSFHPYAQKGKLLKLIKTELPVNVIKSSPNRDLIAVGDYTNDPLGFKDLREDYTVTIIDGKEFSVLHKLKGHTDKVEALSFSLNSKNLVSSDSDGNIIAWDLIKGKSLINIKTNEWVHEVMFSNSGAEIIAIQGFEKRAVLYDLKGNEISTFNLGVQINDFALNRNTNQIYFGCHNELQIWSLISRQKKKTFPLKGIYCIRFNKDYSEYAIGFINGEIRTYNSNSFHETSILKGHFKPVISLSFNEKNEKIVSSSSDQTIRVWRLADGKELLNLTNEHRGSVLSVEFLTKDDLFASGGENLELKVWR